MDLVLYPCAGDRPHESRRLLLLAPSTLLVTSFTALSYMCGQRTEPTSIKFHLTHIVAPRQKTGIQCQLLGLLPALLHSYGTNPGYVQVIRLRVVCPLFVFQGKDVS
ncbi:hypothetical protein ARMSODRAFT_607639 [Armillaria solidipes]|uniref:Uncharacterized protein n=1 Tax=Armillaria solidipes TaxID=1076256 RepID=A0A2H3AU02_9AGAR|nr:hypothetical protein ARMSODRAFT_607639 [Armillaria solidipes]